MAGVTLNLVPSGVGAFNLPNAPGQVFRTTLARTPSKSHSPLNTEIKIVEVHHGRMTCDRHGWNPTRDGGIVGEEVVEATLLLFHIEFHSRLQDRRYKSVRVRLDFLDKTRDERRHPEVYRFAPARTHWLRKTTHGRTTTYGASLAATSGGGPAGGEAGVHWQTETEKTVHSKALLVGKATMSDGKERDGANAVEWSMEENKGQGDGVPTFLQAAVLLKRAHSEHFYVRLHVSSEVDSVSRRLDRNPLVTPFRPSDEDPVIDDVCLRSGQVQMRNLDLSGIRPSDLEHMERLDINRYWQVNQSEQDVLVNHGQPAPPPPPGDLEDGGQGQEAPESLSQVQGDVGVAEPPSPPPLTEHVSANDRDNHDGPSSAEQHTVQPRPTLTPLPANATLAAVEAVAKAAEAAAKAAEAAAKAAEAASHAVGALIRMMQGADNG